MVGRYFPNRNPVDCEKKRSLNKMKRAAVLAALYISSFHVRLSIFISAKNNTIFLFLYNKRVRFVTHPFVNT